LATAQSWAVSNPNHHLNYEFATYINSQLT
jgi:hypothetical protein